MSFTLVIHEEAFREVDQAERFIEARRTDYGILFRNEVGAALERIRQRPNGFPKRRGEFRYGIVTKFPYRIVFRVKGNEVFVAAVYHGKRREFGWAKRKFE